MFGGTCSDLFRCRWTLFRFFGVFGGTARGRNFGPFLRVLGHVRAGVTDFKTYDRFLNSKGTHITFTIPEVMSKRFAYDDLTK